MVTTKQTTKKAVLVDPFNNTITEIEISKKLNLEEFYENMDCEIVQPVFLEDRVQMMVDEMGLLKHNNFFQITNSNKAQSSRNKGIYAGKAIFFKMTKDFTLEDFKFEISFLGGTEEVREKFFKEPLK